MAEDDAYGKWIRRREFADCPQCGYVDLGPGRLSDDRTIEVRTCECGTEIDTVPYFTCPPGEATAWNLQ
jgi:hypothetical protein